MTLGHVPVSIFRLSYETESRDHSSPSGSAWRGAFGHALRKMVCVTKEKLCTGCPVLRSCLYTYIFESPPPENTEKMRLYRTVPHPYALYLPEKRLRGEIVASPFFPGGDKVNQKVAEMTAIDLTLYGHSGEFFPHILHAFSRAAERGLGSQRTPYRLTGAQQFDPKSSSWEEIYVPGKPPRQKTGEPVRIPTMPKKVIIHFLSPLRITVEGDLMTPDRLTFGALFRTLFRRISMIRYFHGDGPIEIDFADLFKRADTVRLTPLSLQWEEGIRYSSRQKTAMNMGGIVGSASLDTTDLAPFWPALWEGQWIQVGKLTTMGLGRYVIEDASTRDP